MRPNVPSHFADDEVRKWGSTYWVQTAAWRADPSLMVSEDYSIEDMHRHYYAAIERCDESVGVVINELEKRGLLDDTLIIFTSDHGENLGSHGLFK